MFAVAVGLAMGSYWLFHYGYYFAKGVPISPLDDLLPSRVPTFLAAIDYWHQAGPYTPASGTPGVNTAPSTTDTTAPGTGGAGPAGQVRQG